MKSRKSDSKQDGETKMAERISNPMDDSVVWTLGKSGEMSEEQQGECDDNVARLCCNDDVEVCFEDPDVWEFNLDHIEEERETWGSDGTPVIYRHDDNWMYANESGGRFNSLAAAAGKVDEEPSPDNNVYRQATGRAGRWWDSDEERWTYYIETGWVFNVEGE